MKWGKVKLSHMHCILNVLLVISTIVPFIMTTLTQLNRGLHCLYTETVSGFICAEVSPDSPVQAEMLVGCHL